MARRGLSGEDRGDAIVGFACAGLGLFALLPTGSVHGAERISGLLAFLLGGAVVAVASLRGARRRALLRDVERGRRRDYRIVTTADGRHLSRVHPEGAGYRIADVEQPLCELDDAGRCLRSLASE
jgi:hypothetical protein